MISKNPSHYLNIPAVEIIKKLPVGLLILKREADSFYIDYFNEALPTQLPTPVQNQDFLEWTGLDEKSHIYASLLSIKGAEGKGEFEFLLGKGLNKDSFHFNVSSLQNDQLMVTITRNRQELNEPGKAKPLMSYDWLLNYLPMTCVLLLDQNKNCENAAGANLKLFKFSMSDLTGRNLKDILRDKRSVQQIEKKLNSSAGATQDFILKKGTSSYQIRTHLMPDDLQGITWIMLIQDVTQQSKTKEELENKLRDLAKSNENLEQFAYVASHDLQEPLRKIRAFGDRLFTKYKDLLDDTGQDYLNRMQNAAGRMQILIEDLLKFSRLTRQENNFELVDLNLLVSDIVSDLEDSIAQSKARIEWDTLPELMIDRSQFRHLFQNLLSNAIKFHKQDVPPIVKLSYSYESNVPESGSRNTDKVKNHHRFEISDNGIGFDEKYLDRIFNIFQRLHGRHEYPGTGIGLAICKKVVENHHGFMAAKSKPNQGSVFIIIIPNQSNKHD